VLFVACGRLGDVLGREQLFVAGARTLPVSLACVACVLAPAVGDLIAFRACRVPRRQ